MNDQRPLRVFVGIKLSPEIAEPLAQLALPLERFAARLVQASNLHVTLVPPWNEDHLPETVEKLRQAVQDFPGFSLAFERIRYGPDPRRPRMLWAVCHAGAEISELKTLLLQVFQRTEQRPFLPHVTLARIPKYGTAVARKNPLDRELAFIQRVDAVQLFRSPEPGSVGYEVLASATLRLRKIEDEL
jgi:2'-5' RNA ligase